MDAATARRALVRQLQGAYSGELAASLSWAIDGGELSRARADARAMEAAAAQAAAGSAPAVPTSSASAPVTLSLLDRFSTVLEAGHRIAVALWPHAMEPGVDTPEDLERVRRHLAGT